MNITSIRCGIYGGLAGGVLFGAMMGQMGLLSMVGGMVGVPSPWVGFVVHMAISAMIGAAFSAWLTITGLPGGVITGLGYGLAWWIVGPLTLMLLFLGMGLGANWSVAAMQQALPSLVGHLMFGGILGVTYQWLQSRSCTPSVGRSDTEAV